MTTRRALLHGAAIAGLGLGSAAVLGPAIAHAEMPTDRIKRNLNGLAYHAEDGLSVATIRFQKHHRLVQDGKPGPVTQSALAAFTGLVQHGVGATMDSSFGDATTAKVKAYQSAHGLEVDGLAGPATMAKMGLVRAPGVGTSAIGGSIRRSEIIQRAAYWPNIGLGYSRKYYHRDLDGSKTYRQDCSGQVSNAFHATQSYSTRSLHNITHEISKSSLLPGDALNCYDYHTYIFCGWANGSRTAAFTFEESGSRGAVGREVSGYPFYSDGRNWKPVRYDKVVWG